MEPIKRRRVTSRRRTVHACETCRRRKIKCDQERPGCAQCADVSRPCTYLDSLGHQSRSVVRTTAPHQELISEERDEEPESPTQQPTGVILCTGTRQRYVGRSTWLRDVLAVSHGESPGRETTNTIKLSEVLVDSPTEVPSRSVTTRDWLLATPRPELDRLVRWFSEYCFLILVVLTPLELDTLRLGCLSTNHDGVDEDDFLLLTTVCYIASLSIESWSPLAGLSRSSRQWKAVVDSALRTRRGPPSLQQIKILVFLALSSISEHYDDSDGPSIGATAVLVRTAQLAGLHREPSKLLENISDEECEERRRLFWAVFELDLNFSLIHGLPTLIDRSAYDVREPTKEAEQTTSPGMRFSVHKTRAGVIFSQVLDKMYGVKPVSRPVFEELVDAAARYQTQVETLTDWEGVTARYVQTCLRLVAHRLIFTIHQFYLRTDRLGACRTRALDACLAFIGNFIDCVLDFTFAPLRWITDHFNVFHPCAIVLQDLILHPNSKEADRSREVLESCFSQLSSPADPKWQMLKRLRQQAWMANHWTEPRGGGDIYLSAVADLADWDALFEPGVFAVPGFE